MPVWLIMMAVGGRCEGGYRVGGYRNVREKAVVDGFGFESVLCWVILMEDELVELLLDAREAVASGALAAL
jgi:hypothetical protein